MIGIIDYGLGNVRAFANIYKNLDIAHVVVSGSEALERCTKYILPGVGAFDHAMELLQHSGMREGLNELVTVKKQPILGVCVGMQMLALSSEEGTLSGLGWIDGVVKKMVPRELLHKTQLPHMGWNSIIPVKNNGLLNGLSGESRFYFLHSYCFCCNNLDDAYAATDYGGEFVSMVNSRNIYGVQFHPEKSHQSGIQVLKNFAEMC